MFNVNCDLFVVESSQKSQHFIKKPAGNFSFVRTGAAERRWFLNEQINSSAFYWFNADELTINVVCFHIWVVEAENSAETLNKPLLCSTKPLKTICCFMWNLRDVSQKVIGYRIKSYVYKTTHSTSGFFYF